MITFNTAAFSDLFSSFNLSVRSVIDSFSSSPFYSKYQDIKNECIKISYIWKQVYYHGMSIDEFDYIFVPQKFQWDCGLACCAMAMQWLQRDFSAVIENNLYLRDTPLWTVELYCLLRELKVDCIMLTQHAGVTPSHRDISWYSENLTDNESERVTACFAFARDHSWNILQVSVCIEQLSELVSSSDFLAIILVDSETLTKRQRRVDVFAGHYIVIVGYDLISDTFLYLNPADSSGLKAVSGPLLEEARTHEGTDEDIILCCKSALSLERFIHSTCPSQFIPD